MITFVFELYAGRTNSQIGSVVSIEDMGDGNHCVRMWALGGRGGLLKVDYGAEKQFVKELVEGVTNRASKVTFGPEYSWD